MWGFGKYCLGGEGHQKMIGQIATATLLTLSLSLFLSLSLSLSLSLLFLFFLFFFYFFLFFLFGFVFPRADRWDHVFATQLQSGYTLKPAELTLDRMQPEQRQQVAYALDTLSLGAQTLHTQLFSAQSPIQLAQSPSQQSFELWHTAPVLAGGYALLGQLDKWVPVAAARISQVLTTSNGLWVTVLGAPNESVRQ